LRGLKTNKFPGEVMGAVIRTRRQLESVGTVMFGKKKRGIQERISRNTRAMVSKKRRDECGRNRKTESS